VRDATDDGAGERGDDVGHYEGKIDTPVAGDGRAGHHGLGGEGHPCDGEKDERADGRYVAHDPEEGGEVGRDVVGFGSGTSDRVKRNYPSPMTISTPQ
jgi:hypothetical protein